MTKEYHNAIAKYYSKLRIVTVPVMAWDLCTSRRNEALSFNAIQREWNLKENFYKAVISIQWQNSVCERDQEGGDILVPITFNSGIPSSRQH